MFSFILVISLPPHPNPQGHPRNFPFFPLLYALHDQHFPFNIHHDHCSQSSRSKVFRNMLDSDECKASAEESITLPDLNHDELHSLLEFLYSGNLIAPYNQYRALYLAADKYDIAYLQDVCRDHFIASLTSRNVLDILELASIPSDTILKAAAINHVVKHMEDVVVPMKYETFVQRNPNLGVEITRAYLREIKALTKDSRTASCNRPHSRMY